MKNVKKRIMSGMLMLGLLAMFMPMLNCNMAQGAAKFNGKTYTVRVGKKLPLALNDAKGKKIGEAKVKWHSKNKKIAKVSQSGVVTGVKIGNTRIIAKYRGNSYACKIRVIAKSSANSRSWKLTNTTSGIDVSSTYGIKSTIYRKYDKEKKSFVQSFECQEDSGAGEWSTVTVTGSEPASTYQTGKTISITFDIKSERSAEWSGHDINASLEASYSMDYPDGSTSEKIMLKTGSKNSLITVKADEGAKVLKETVTAQLPAEKLEKGTKLYLVIGFSGSGNENDRIEKIYEYTWM